jgi:von Willebrand factor type A domain-containing protein
VLLVPADQASFVHFLFLPVVPPYAITRTVIFRISLFLSAFAGAVALPLGTEETSCQHRSLPVYVHDGQGRPIRGLTTADFEGKFQGKTVKLLSLHPDTRPRQIAVLLDISGSMKGEALGHEWEVAREVASHIVRSELKDTSLAFLLFSDHIQEQIDFSHPSVEIAKRLQEIGTTSSFEKKYVRGRTALRDVLLSAVDVFGGSDSSRSVYVISDGGDNASHSTFEEVRHAVGRSGVRIYFVVLEPEGIASSRNVTPKEIEGSNEVRDLVKSSGGMTFDPFAPDPLGRVNYQLSEEDRRILGSELSRLYQAMVSNDLLDVELPNLVEKWSRWKLTFSAEKARLYRDAAIEYPQELVPCKEMAR